jgi:FkbM family methyltransferase
MTRHILRQIYFMKLAIIDSLGLCYDGDTLSKQGLGGSESAVILIAKNLQQIGFEVTVFNNCEDGTHSAPGVYDGVRYIDNRDAKTHDDVYDIAIVSRTAIPFVSQDWPFVHTAKKRVLWLHDTFIEGDQIVEDLAVSGKIDHIFTLSDWHTSYILTCAHGKKRNYEVLKRKVFQTRNGAVCHILEVDLSRKDPGHFVYNASATKGMLPLVNDIWPEIKKRLPRARLTVIGGYYRFREGAEPDEQENTVEQLSKRQDLKDLGITFTGVIPQPEIAKILANAWMMLYPGAFPETFGISSLESLLYKTPLMTTRFGALEETAVDLACYHIDYAIEPNSLFPHINKEQQVQKFLEAFFCAYATPYLHQQKQNYCDVVKNVAGWDTVALQWKQFFYSVMGEFLSVDEYRKVTRINAKVARVFGRTGNMPVQKEFRSFGEQKSIVVISPFWNAAAYIEKNIRSVASQDYDNYLHILIDDASDDDSYQIAKRTIESLPQNLQEKFLLLTHDENRGCIHNQLDTIKDFADSDDIVMLLDGDDWLINNNTIFHYYNDIYSQGYEFTYGSMWSVADNIPLIAQEYPENDKREKSYREYLFNWKIPYTHLRTCLGKHFDGLDKSKFQVDGKWMKSGADNPLFYELIEQIEPEKIYCNREIVCCYNDANPLNDFKIRSTEQNQNANRSYHKGDKMNRFSVVVPTMWRAEKTFLPFLEKLIRLDIISEILIINNDPSKTPVVPSILENRKIRMISFGENIYVNPAWNIGVALSKNDKICIMNDDVQFDTKLFEKIVDHVNPSNGVTGISPGLEKFNQKKHTNNQIDIVEWNKDHTFGFGCLMFVHKQNWTPIPDNLKIYFGDNFIFDTLLRRGFKNYLITNIDYNTDYAQTTKDESITSGFMERESEIYQNLFPKPKKILVAIPTSKYIEVETFQSLWNLDVPDGYQLDFQYFFGYQTDQVRNLAAEWAKRYDYMLAVDSDIVLPKDALTKMIVADKDIISGLYIQRIPNTHTLEVYMDTPGGGCTNIPYDLIKDRGIVQIAACGMGAALIKSEVFRKMTYPHFFYKSALTMKDTVSEDVYFCRKAREAGFTVWADASIKCDHKGSNFFVVDQPKSHLKRVAENDLLPKEHADYLRRMGISPKVVYDIGACVQHWTRKAKEVWPEAKYYLFDATKSVEPFLKTDSYAIAVLSDTDGKLIDFYEDSDNPGGNSYYKETTGAFNDSHKSKRMTITLDTITKQNDWALPDLIKLDVQGAEIDVLRGAKQTLMICNDIILEAQHVNYNEGAPKFDQVKSYLEAIGFILVNEITRNDIDGDYHFTRKSSTIHRI